MCTFSNIVNVLLHVLHMKGSYLVYIFVVVYVAIEQKDLVLLGILSSRMNRSEKTVSTKRKSQKERSRQRTYYAIESAIVCRDAFLFINWYVIFYSAAAYCFIIYLQKCANFVDCV